MESTLFPPLAVLLVILLFIFSLLSRYQLSNITESSQLLRWGSEMGVFWNTAWQGAVIWITSESETQMTSERTGYTQSMVSPFPRLPSSESLWHLHVQVLCYKCMVSRSGLFEAEWKHGILIQWEIFCCSGHKSMQSKAPIALPQPHTSPKQ